MRPIYRGWHCDDCHKPCDNEYYWVKPEVWEAAGMTHLGPGKLCIRCLEERLRRPLIDRDFIYVDPAGSRRLKNRAKPQPLTQPV